jgi:hypothetical protein
VAAAKILADKAGTSFTLACLVLCLPLALNLAEVEFL